MVARLREPRTAKSVEEEGVAVAPGRRPVVRGNWANQVDPFSALFLQ
jgi:hypothetical protein